MEMRAIMNEWAQEGGCGLRQSRWHLDSTAAMAKRLLEHTTAVQSQFIGKKYIKKHLLAILSVKKILLM